jgi:hypothetical protein
MAFTGNTPDFPFRGVSLITSPAFGPTSVEGRVVIQCQPYGVVDGQIVRPMTTVDVDGVPTEVVDTSRNTSRSFVDAYAAAAGNPAYAQALALISQGIQLLIDAEGL